MPATQALKTSCWCIFFPFSLVSGPGSTHAQWCPCVDELLSRDHVANSLPREDVYRNRTGISAHFLSSPPVTSLLSTLSRLALSALRPLAQPWSAARAAPDSSCLVDSAPLAQSMPRRHPCATRVHRLFGSLNGRGIRCAYFAFVAHVLMVVSALPMSADSSSILSTAGELISFLSASGRSRHSVFSMSISLCIGWTQFIVKNVLCKGQ